MTVHREQSMKREDQQDETIRCLLLTSVSTYFGLHYAHLQENKGPVTALGVLFWFCWMWLVAVVGRCLAGCEHYKGFCSTETFIVITSCKTAPQNRYQPHPAEPEQHTKCSNRAFVLLKMGIMMARNILRQKLIINIWVLHLVGFFSPHFAHDARSQEPKEGIVFK